MSKEAKYQIEINIEADCKAWESLILDLLAAVFSWADRHEKIKLGSRCLLPHTCGDLAGQRVGWPAPRHVERQGRYWGAAMLGRRAGGRKWPGEWRGPSSKGVIDVYVLCNLTSPLHYFDDVNKPIASWPFPLLLSEQLLSQDIFVFLSGGHLLYIYLSQFCRKMEIQQKMFCQKWIVPFIVGRLFGLFGRNAGYLPHLRSTP